MKKKKGVKSSLFFLGIAYGNFPLLWGCLVQVGVNSPLPACIFSWQGAWMGGPALPYLHTGLTWA